MTRKFGIEIEVGNETIQLPVAGDGWNLIEKLREHANENGCVEEARVCINLGNKWPEDTVTHFNLNNTNDIQWLFAYDSAAYWMQRMGKKGRRYFRKYVYDIDSGSEELRSLAIEASEITE